MHLNGKKNENKIHNIMVNYKIINNLQYKLKDSKIYFFSE